MTVTDGRGVSSSVVETQWLRLPAEAMSLPVPEPAGDLPPRDLRLFGRNLNF